MVQFQGRDLFSHGYGFLPRAHHTSLATWEQATGTWEQCSAVQGGTGAELLVMGGGWHTPSRWEAWDRHQAGNQKSNHLLMEESRLTEERAHWEGESWLTEKERAH